MSYDTFNVGDVFTAADAQNLMNQGTIICTSTTRPTVTTTGLAIYETDTKRIYRWNGSAWECESDNGAFSLSWTPTYSALSLVSVNALYKQVGKMVSVDFSGEYNGYSGPWTISLPVAAKSGRDQVVGSAALNNTPAGGQRYLGDVMILSGANTSFCAFTKVTGSNHSQQWSNNYPVVAGLSPRATLRCLFTYEAA